MVNVDFVGFESKTAAVAGMFEEGDGSDTLSAGVVGVSSGDGVIGSAAGESDGVSGALEGAGTGGCPDDVGGVGGDEVYGSSESGSFVGVDLSR